jgi:hypothetical protein
MKATFIFVSPFKGYKKVAANIKHEGTWKNFKCDANIKRGKEIIKANWWDTDALTFLYPLKGVCAATIISIVGLIANLMSPESMSCFPRAISAWHLKFVNLKLK